MNRDIILWWNHIDEIGCYKTVLASYLVGCMRMKTTCPYIEYTCPYSWIHTCTIYWIGEHLPKSFFFVSWYVSMTQIIFVTMEDSNFHLPSLAASEKNGWLPYDDLHLPWASGQVSLQCLEWNKIIENLTSCWGAIILLFPFLNVYIGL